MYGLNTIYNLFCGVERVPKVSWRGLFEQTRRLKGLLFRVPFTASVSMTKEIALAGCSFVSFVVTLKRKSGYLYTALYLKQCSVTLQQFYAGCYKRDVPLSVPISLTRSGIPRIIPAVLRKSIRSRSDHGDILVRIYLSWFGLNRLMLVAKRVSKATFKSIASPHPDIGKVLEVLDEIKTSFRDLQPMYLPFLQQIPLELGIRWEPTWKSTPMTSRFVRRYRLSVDDHVDQVMPKYDKFENIFSNLKHEIAAFLWNINKIHSIPDGFFSPGILWRKGYYLYPLDRNNTRFANDALEYFERCVGPYFDGYLYPYRNVPLATGRLCQVIEGGGKRRIFAICNYIKQRLLFPVHKWSMEVLSRLPADGTFNQERPLLKLREGRKNNCYSFDLKSATDRWPLSVMFALMSCMFGPTLASSIVNSSLGLNTFLVDKPIVQRMSEVAFLCGQPLGYYSSWSLFALSHHYIVWLAAKKADPLRVSPFKDYALLGDDILITDPKVAHEYRVLLDRLGVTISEAKSIVSETGCVEFAKKFWVKSMQKDLSPVSLRLLLSCRTTIGLVTIHNKYSLGIAALQRLGGAGYRVRSRIYSTQSKRWERLKAAHCKPNRSHALPLEWWIGRGKPLNPYLKGKIVAYLRKELKPKEITLFPEEMVFDKERDILEHTVILNWMKLWLKWCHWYYTVAMSENVSLDDLMDVPMCSTSWKRPKQDLDLIKFGLIWKCYDMGAGWYQHTTPRWLFDPNTVILHHRWILGGFSGSDFIMAPVD